MSYYTKLNKENGQTASGIQQLNKYGFPVCGYARALYFAMRSLCADYEGKLRQDEKTPCSDAYLCGLVGLRSGVPEELRVGKAAVKAILKERLFCKDKEGTYYLVRFDQMFGKLSDSIEAEKKRKQRERARKLQLSPEQVGDTQGTFCPLPVLPLNNPLKSLREQEPPSIPLDGGSSGNGNGDDDLKNMAKDFFGKYPKKEKLMDVIAWFSTNKPSSRTYSAILIALARDAVSSNWRKSGGRFVPLPSEWLAKTRWTKDDLTMADYQAEEEKLNSEPESRSPEPTSPAKISLPNPKKIPEKGGA